MIIATKPSTNFADHNRTHASATPNVTGFPVVFTLTDIPPGDDGATR
jgi:hypothetical protein